jgi:hypothetical protein
MNWPERISLINYKYKRLYFLIITFKLFLLLKVDTIHGSSTAWSSKDELILRNGQATTLIVPLALNKRAYSDYESSAAQDGFNDLIDSSEKNYSDQNQNATKSRLEILEETLGPRKKPLSFVICMSTVYILILMCGIIGNISTCCVIITNNCMHTTTNYYLFSLAVSDVLSLLTGK